MDLFNNTAYIVKQISANLELFKGKIELVKQLLTGKPIKSMVSKVTDLDEMKSRPVYLKLFELSFSLVKLASQIEKQLNESIEIDIGLSEVVEKCFNSVKILEDGTKFTK